ncbi:MAG: peptidyl-prolyl cis-trans isomerase, partial [Candidatus Omnitrophica bacterium]|nr:peptidyl-prolyl cis-trans isomerase [Candidatus Omnitrophota bacterium]
AYVPEFKDIKEAVKEKLIQDETKRTAKQKTEECLKALKEAYKQNANPADFDKEAKVFGLKSGETKPFKFGSYIEGIGSSDNFWMAANQLKENQPSDIITEPSGFYIVRLKSRAPIDEDKFQKEKQQFSQLLLSQKKEETFAKFLEDLKKQSSGN